MSRLEYEYEGLDEGVEPLATPSADGEAWQPPAQPPGDFPPRPAFNPDADAPPIWGAEHGIKPRRPLVFVPGIGATQLETYRVDPNNGPYAESPVWPPFDLAQGKPVWLARLTNPRKRPVKKMRVPFVSHAYQRLISFLDEQLGYGLDEHLFLFPYDWTRSNRDSGRRLTGFVNRVIDHYQHWPAGLPDDQKKVDVLCHSMGGLVTRAAVRLFGAPVRGTMYLASPHYGAAKAYFFLHERFRALPWIFDFSLRKFTELGHEALTGAGLTYEYLFGVVKWDTTDINKTVKWVFSSFPSVYELLPEEEYFVRQRAVNPNGAPSIVSVWTSSGRHIAERVVTGVNSTYFTDAMTELDNTQQGMANLALDFKKALGLTLPGEIYFVVASQSVDTIDHGDIWNGVGSSHTSKPRNGDGTVPWISGRGPDRVTEVSGSHNYVPESPETHWWVARFLAESG